MIYIYTYIQFCLYVYIEIVVWILRLQELRQREGPAKIHSL
jgi:hypothetical protein